MREQHHLHGRVTMLGTLPHDMVREVLVQGQVRQTKLRNFILKEL